mgnify:FL=1
MLLLITFLFIQNHSFCQSNYSDSPLNALFEINDTKVFWNSFDKMKNSSENPFKDYVEKGSAGVKGFTQSRIINADSLFTMVKKHRSDYESTRNVLDGISAKEKRVRAIYSALKYWYPNAKFPPVYFVYGRFNSGGTSSEDGIIIGTEKLKNLDGVTGLIAHELIHYQQKIEGNEMLLKWTLNEGGADFIGEFISGESINGIAYKYGEQNLDKLCKEFVSRLKESDYQDWLYGTSGKDNRPNDLGYWIGYKVIEAYFNKQEDKHKAINDIINIKEPLLFLKQSGFLDSYIKEYQKSKKQNFDEFFKNDTVP